MRALLAGAVAALALSHCKSENGVGDVLLVARVAVTPGTATISPLETLQLTATPFTEGGIELPARNVRWSSQAPNVVSVSDSGMIQAHAFGGPVTIEASIEGVVGQAAITVTLVPVDRVTVLPAQASVLVGATVQLDATAYDAQGNVLPARGFAWQSSAPGTAAVTSTGLVLGMAAGGPVTVTASSGGKSAGSSVRVLPRPATRLGFVQQPSATVVGQAMTPPVRVAIQDDLSGTVTSATNSVTIALASNPGGATLSGTLTVNAVNGIATFNNLKLDKAGNGYSLQAASSGLSPALSNGFNVAGSGPASRLTITTQPATTDSDDEPFTQQPVIQLRDAAGNAVAQRDVNITASLNSGPLLAQLKGTRTVKTDAAGVARFSNLEVDRSGTYTLRFSASGLTSVVSASFTVP